MEKIKHITAALLVAFLAFSCSPKVQPEVVELPEKPFAAKPKNIVLMIGDGMGLTQMSAFLYANDNNAAIEKFPIVGFQKTPSANNLVTDSAGAATAMACGEKTHNSAIGVDVDTVACETILESFENRGLATGLVATASIVHATPAAFIAHVDLRNFYESIAADFLNTDIDYFAGGGEKYFGERKTDNKNLLRSLREKGYYVTEYSPSSRDFQKDKIAWFTAKDQPGAYGAGRTYLPGATFFGLKFLDQKSEDGFFMMVEGSQIDWACHYNDQRMFLEEMEDFNRAITKVLEFASRDKETLIIVTGDHECGGMALNQGNMFGKVDLKFTTNGHTATLVPVYAYGPGAELFSGIYENNAIHQKIFEALGWDINP